MNKKLLIAAGVLVIVIAAFPFLPADPTAQDRGSPFHAPNAIHWLGTDGLGRDIWARTLQATRLSCAAAALAAVIAIGTAAVLGSTAGYFLGWVDEGLMGVAELFQSLPWIFFVLGIRALLPLSLSPAESLLTVALVAGLTGWMRAARIVRGVVLEARGRDYVAAARSFGASSVYLLRRHIIPETVPVLLVQAVILLPQFVIIEVTLSFLGLGSGEPTPSLGGMLIDLRDVHVMTSYPWMWCPAVALILVAATMRLFARLTNHHVPGLN
ncbi:MAG: ABC transporter permease [Acidobacteriota bacterium]|nr:ABC transporter permease [Acidobacteriota bacterium]